MPNFLHNLAKYNQLHGITTTHSEMKKTARRMAKLHAADVAAGIEREADAYILDYQDPVGEEATENVMQERNHINAQRRVAQCNEHAA